MAAAPEGQRRFREENRRDLLAAAPVYKEIHVNARCDPCATAFVTEKQISPPRVTRAGDDSSDSRPRIAYKRLLTKFICPSSRRSPPASREIKDAARASGSRGIRGNLARGESKNRVLCAMFQRLTDNWLARRGRATAVA